MSGNRHSRVGPGPVEKHGYNIKPITQIINNPQPQPTQGQQGSQQPVPNKPAQSPASGQTSSGEKQ